MTKYINQGICKRCGKPFKAVYMTRKHFNDTEPELECYCSYRCYMLSEEYNDSD